jgi:ketosteroid isomerase-like protein
MRASVILLLLFVPVVVSGQTANIDPSLKAAVEARTAARYAGDVETFARHTMEDAIFVNGRGLVETTKQRIDAIRTTKGTRDPITEERYQTFGDTAIRTWRGPTNRWIEVWVKKNGTWKVAAVQFTPVTPS